MFLLIILLINNHNKLILFISYLKNKSYNNTKLMAVDHADNKNEFHKLPKKYIVTYIF